MTTPSKAEHKGPLQVLAELLQEAGAVPVIRPFIEPPYVGTPNDCDWPGYHTHFVRLTNEMIPVRADAALEDK